MNGVSRRKRLAFQTQNTILKNRSSVRDYARKGAIGMCMRPSAIKVDSWIFGRLFSETCGGPALSLGKNHKKTERLRNTRFWQSQFLGVPVVPRLSSGNSSASVPFQRFEQPPYNLCNYTQILIQ